MTRPGEYVPKCGSKATVERKEGKGHFKKYDIGVAKQAARTPIVLLNRHV